MCLSKDIISAYCDGETEGKITTMIETHLQECSRCQEIANKYKMLSNTMKNKAFTPSTNDVKRLANQLRLLQAQTSPKKGFNGIMWRAPVVKIAVFLFILLFAFTFILFSVIIFTGGSREGQTMMASAPTETVAPERQSQEPSPHPLPQPDSHNLRTVDY